MIRYWMAFGTIDQTLEYQRKFGKGERYWTKFGKFERYWKILASFREIEGIWDR